MPKGPLRLFIKSPGQEERVYDMADGSVTIGRDRTAEIPVEDRTLSRRHCRVYVGADGWRVTDLGSRNGTFLNGSPILDDRLEAGDSVELGETKITAYFPEGDGSETLDEADLESILARAMKQPKARAATVAGRHREIRALTHLMELNEKINALRDEDQLLEGILDAAIELTDAGRGFLLLKQEDHFIVRRARLPDHRDLTDPDGSFSVSVAARVIADGISVLSEDMQMDDRFEGNASVANLKLRSLVCVPLHTRKGVIGAIYLDNAYERGTFDGWDAVSYTHLTLPTNTVTCRSRWGRAH